MKLRPFEEADTEAIIALIDGIYHHYGYRIHLEGAEADLKDVSAHFGPGKFQVLDDQGVVRGTAAIAPDPEDGGGWFLKRLYLDPDLHGQGWADTLLDWAIEEARSLGAQHLDLWSDVRFERAHAFYAKRGFERVGAPRTMHDSWSPYQEYFYTRAL